MKKDARQQHAFFIAIFGMNDYLLQKIIFDKLINTLIMAKNRMLIVFLIVLNAIVLFGQVYPEGAPPFARVVNIIFLFLSLVFFIASLRRKN